MDRGSYDSTSVPLNNTRFQQNYSNPNFQDAPNTPFQDEPKYNTQGYGSAIVPPRKRRISPWIKFGLPVLVVVAIAAIVGGVVGSHSSKKASALANASGSPNSPNGSPAGPGKTGLDGLAVFPVSTDSYELPVYPQTVRHHYFSHCPEIQSTILVNRPTLPCLPHPQSLRILN